MTVNDWVNLIVSVLAGLATCIPLVVQLVKFVQAAAKEKNWSKIMQLVLTLMTEAEKNYATGAERKEYVMDSIESIKDVLDYEVDMNAISQMIDEIVKASKTINTPVIAEKK
jgi:esterase/lipase